jgi:hypothetical protein
MFAREAFTRPSSYEYVVQRKSEFGKLLTVLSRSADVIDDTETDDRIRRLALAA